MEPVKNDTKPQNLPLWAQLRKNHGFATTEELKEFEMMAMKDAGESKDSTTKDACSEACQSNCEKGISCQSNCEGNLEHHDCPTNCEQACLGPCENSTVSQ